MGIHFQSVQQHHFHLNLWWFIYDYHIHADINYEFNMNLNYKNMIEICKKINIPFQNQSISSVLREYEDIFFELKRIKLTKKENLMSPLIKKIYVKFVVIN